MKRTLLFVAFVLASVAMQARVARVSNLEYAHAIGRYFVLGESNPDVTKNPLYGEWWLMGWNEGGSTFEVDTNFVCNKHLSIEISAEGYVKAYSMVNEIFMGKLTLNGNEMIFEGGGAMTEVYGDVMENLFFEDRIFGIKSYQLDGNLLRLYYTDNDYFVFTSDIIDSDEYYFEWKNGLTDPYIGEVTVINDEEVDVKVISSPSIATFYFRTMPPTGNNEVCHFTKSDLAGLSFNVGDKVAFRISQFKRLKVEKGREYQLKVEPCSGAEHVTDRTGTMHNDRRMGWIIIDNEVNKREGGIYYYPLKVLPEAYLIEGLPVTFSGELFPTWRMPWDNQGNSDCYYMRIDAIASHKSGDDYRPLVEEGKHWTYDNFMPLRPAEYDHYYYYDLRGDTLIAGKNCLKMYSENQYNDSITRYEGALYEEGKKVYSFFPQKDEAVLLYDFDCKVGDTLHVSEGQMVVKDIQTEDNGGIAIRKYTLHAEDDIDFCWIEGVGATNDFFGMLPLAGNYNTLKACELNGEKLYQTIEPDYTAKGYHKMGIEGKRWNYIHYYLDADGEHREPYSYVVKGDTIIRRTTYKKLWYQDEKTERLVCLLNEHGREVLKSLDFGDNSYDTPLMKSFFAFDREDFGRVFTWKAENYSGNTNWMVYGVDTIEVKGQPFRRYTCLQKYSEEGEKLTTIEYDGESVWHDIWVEGVGSASSGIEDQTPHHEPALRTTSDYTYFVSCYEDGECIFTADDFNTQREAVINMAYRPFVEEGKVWKVGDATSGNPVQWVEYYYFDGDTIIDGKTCKQMMCQRYVSPDFPEYEAISQQPSLSYVGAWYEEDKKVYFCNAGNKQYRLIYDFSINANDTLQIDNLPYLYVVGPRQTRGIKGFKGVYRDVWECRGGESIYRCAPWLEGVGGIYGSPIFNVCNVELADPSCFLISCTVGDEVIYLNDEYEDGATPEEARKRIDFTHTIKTKPKMPRRSKGARASSPAEDGQTLYGEYNNLQLDINLDPLDDAYLVRITDETGKTVYEKNINAACIVGLNIDISDYTAGRYTVTVENGQESFIGVFETQTTGIEEVLVGTEASSGWHRACPYTGVLYNLQGQRISSLQKGLNIMNGQKVYVK